MKAEHRRLLLSTTVAIAVGCAPTEGPVDESEQAFSDSSPFEVWLLDQSNSFSTFGGRIYIYNGEDLEDDEDPPPTDVIDLAGATASLCMTQTAANPVRPHMIFFSPNNAVAIVSFVASGHVVFFDAATRTPVTCIRSTPGAGGARQAHAAIPSPDGTYVLLANQNGKLLERINTDYSTNTYAIDPLATIDLANCTTPNGVACQLAGVRPDNAPICGLIDSSGSNTSWITLRGGGLFAVNAASTPMQIIGEYDNANVAGNGCGGAQNNNTIYINSGGGTAANLYQFDIYSFPRTGYASTNPPNTPARTHIFSDNADQRDSHGMTIVAGKLWAFDRGTNVIEVFDAATGAHLITDNIAVGATQDPTPDIADNDPDGTHVFVAMRGPNPLSGDPHVSTGTTPGLMVLEVKDGGLNPKPVATVRVTNIDAGGVERADPHGLKVRRL